MTGTNPTGAPTNSSYPGSGAPLKKSKANFSHSKPMTPITSVNGEDAPENNKSALIFPLATTALGATFAFAGRSDWQRIFGAVTCVTLLGETAFAYVIRNKTVTKMDDHGWPKAINLGALLAPVTGAMLAGAVHFRPATLKRIVPTAIQIVVAELALKSILYYSKPKIRTENIQKIGMGLQIAATAAYTGFLVRTR